METQSLFTLENKSQTPIAMRGPPHTLLHFLS